jgi:hypothetical protein
MRFFMDRGLCRSILETVAGKAMSMITAYPAIAADAAGLDPVYCVVCDAEISRAWVAAEPASYSSASTRTGSTGSCCQGM